MDLGITLQIGVQVHTNLSHDKAKALVELWMLNTGDLPAFDYQKAALYQLGRCTEEELENLNLTPLIGFVYCEADYLELRQVHCDWNFC